MSLLPLSRFHFLMAKKFLIWIGLCCESHGLPECNGSLANLIGLEMGIDGALDVMGSDREL